MQTEILALAYAHTREAHTSASTIDDAPVPTGLPYIFRAWSSSVSSAPSVVKFGLRIHLAFQGFTRDDELLHLARSLVDA